MVAAAVPFVAANPLRAAALAAGVCAGIAAAVAFGAWLWQVDRWRRSINAAPWEGGGGSFNGHGATGGW